MKCYSPNALTLVGMLVSVAHGGGLGISVTERASPGPGFRAYTVGVYGFDGTEIAGVGNLSITGIHQVWQNNGGNGDTPLVGDASEGVFGRAEWDSFDTHLLVDMGMVTTSPGFALSETNSRSNPGGVNLMPDFPFQVFAGSAGIGNLQFTGTDSMITFASPQSSVDLLQGVIFSAISNLSIEVIDERGTRRKLQEFVGGGLLVEPEMTVIGDGEFGTIRKGSPAERTITIENPGYDALNVEADIIGPFEIVGEFPSWIEAMESESFTVRLNTSNLGIAEGQLWLAPKNASYLPDICVDLSAVVVPEPSTFALTGLALVGFAAYTLRHK